MYIMSMNVRTVVFTRNFTDHYSYHIHYKTLVKLKRIIDNVYIFHDKQHKKGLPCHVWSLLYFYVNMYFGTYRKLKTQFGLIWKKFVRITNYLLYFHYFIGIYIIKKSNNSSQRYIRYADYLSITLMTTSHFNGLSNT